MAETKLKRALIAVYDKTGVADFARTLVNEFGIEILSTGGTARHLQEAGIPVTLVEQVTGFPEMLDGRVKTLHPKIHAAILADRDKPEHMRQLAEQGIEPIDMVVVNLYPFEATIAKPDCKFEDAIEMIDIGGPCLLRAAAKNHKHVLPVMTRRQFPDVLTFLRKFLRNAWAPHLPRLEYALRAFGAIASYDRHVSQYLAAHWLTSECSHSEVDIEAMRHPMTLPDLCHPHGLRYGENPHQRAQGAIGDSGIDGVGSGLVSCAPGTVPSYNNCVDASAALDLCRELTRGLSWLCGEGPEHVGPAFQPVSPPVTEERHKERHLPHIENPGATYFVTFRLRSGELDSDERDVVFAACKHWHGEKMTVHACAVMPNHVHLLITPHESSPGQWVALGEIMQSVKGYTGREINKKRGQTGSLWLDENWDRIVRNEKEFGERWEYIENNPGRWGLGDDYRWLWLNDQGWAELGKYQERKSREWGGGRGADDRLESRSHSADDRLESRSHRLGRSHRARTSVVTFIKHTNACGCGIAAEALDAYRRAYLGDPNAAMGGILACNFHVSSEFAAAVMETYDRWGKAAGAGGFFVEVWVAPTFDEQAVEIIRNRKKWGEKVRLLPVGDMHAAPSPNEMEIRSITGGVLMQTRDLIGLNEEQWEVVTDRKPTAAEMDDLRLAWLVCKHTKSNAITVCRDGMLIGNGAGQMSRVMSCRIAVWAAQENGHLRRDEGTEGRRDGGMKGRGDEGAQHSALGTQHSASPVAASDAFFPFRDGPDLLLDAGVTAIIQPGGSKRDAEVIAACNERGAAMLFTHTRHFKH